MSTTPPGCERRGFHTITLGCKLNQFDSAAMEGELRRRGLSPEADPERAQVVIVNTCTVTHRADGEARKLIRSVRRRNPDCRLLVTGCYAELDPAAIHAISGVDRVFGNREKSQWAEILDELGIVRDAATVNVPDPRIGFDRGCDAPLDSPAAPHYGERSRAFLKVQEGCRLACSYCIIPQVRGPSRSVPADEIETAALSLFESGFREVVLTGVNTGDYGKDLRPASNLAALLRRLLSVIGPNRLRLNSLEPLTVTDEIVELMASEPRLASHLQVPLQSGADAILQRMRRNYRTYRYLERLGRLREAVPTAGLGADVIVGFPGETDELFRQTHALIADSPLNYLHVFSWSPRPGTPAAEMDDRVPEPVIRERSASLRALAAAKSLRFRRSLEGRSFDAVVLCERPGDGRIRALTGNFVEVLLPRGSAEPRALLTVRLEQATKAGTFATVDGTPAWSRALAT